MGVRRGDGRAPAPRRSLRAGVPLAAALEETLEETLRSIRMEAPSPEQTSPGRPWLGAFAYPAFATLWLASTTAMIGIAMYDTASGWLMTTLDLNPLDVSLVHAATNLPMFLFTLPAGAIADIFNPRKLIVAVSCATAVLISIFAAIVSFDLASPMMLLLTTFLLSA